MRVRWILVLGGMVAAGVIVAIWASTGQRQEPATPVLPSSSEVAEQLRALPYVHWRPVEEGETLSEGVVHYDRARVRPGANLYCPEDESVARLIDMEGTVLHTWTNDREDWHHVELDAEGDLFVVCEQALVKMNWNSEILWTTEGSFHHDIAVDDAGTLHSLMSQPKYVSSVYGDVPILDDLVVTLAPDGMIQSTFSLWALFGEDVDPHRLERIATLLERGNTLEDPLLRDFCDVLHTNSIQVLERSLPGVARKGDLLISIREIDTIAILPVDGSLVAWSWGPGELYRQHHPTMLDNGHILIFDNQTKEVGSRVIELDPSTNGIVWEYRTSDPREFWSQRSGACQRLESGNTLITDSLGGRVFEVTPTGETVWDFRTEVKDRNKHRLFRGAIYRMTRVDGSLLRGLPFDDSVRRGLEEQGCFQGLLPPDAD